MCAEQSTAIGRMSWVVLSMAGRVQGEVRAASVLPLPSVLRAYAALCGRCERSRALLLHARWDLAGTYELGPNRGS